MLSEDDLIARYFAPLAGAGGFGLLDDAAMITPPAGHSVVLSCDALVAGVHFFERDPPEKIAQKALRVNLSDLAAKGAKPCGFLLSLALAKNTTADWLAAFANGLGADAGHYACPLLGGDTVKTSGPLTLSITVLGTVPDGRMIARTKFQAGDALYVTGTIGDGALGLLAHPDYLGDNHLHHLPDVARAALINRYLLPQPRLALCEALQNFAHGGMDISDGLIGDLTKALTVSGCGGKIMLFDVPLSSAAQAVITQNPALLTTALTGGDDYELLLAIPKPSCAAFEQAAFEANIQVTQIGEVLPQKAGIEFYDAHNQKMTFSHAKYSHF